MTTEEQSLKILRIFSVGRIFSVFKNPQKPNPFILKEEITGQLFCFNYHYEVNIYWNSVMVKENDTISIWIGELAFTVLLMMPLG